MTTTGNINYERIANICENYTMDAIYGGNPVFETAMCYQFIMNVWRYGVGLPCRLFQTTTAFDGKLHYTACYQLADFNAECLIETQKKIKTKG